MSQNFSSKYIHPKRFTNIYNSMYCFNQLKNKYKHNNQLLDYVFVNLFLIISLIIGCNIHF